MSDGWIVQEVSPSFRENLLRRGVPSAAVPRICALAEMYRAGRDGEELTPAEVRADLEIIERAAAKLTRALWERNAQTGDALALAAHRIGRPSTIEQLNAELQALGNVIAAAWQSIEPKGGRPGGPRQFMARCVAFELRQAGVNPTARSAEPFCQALRSILDELGEPGRPDIAKIAKRALADLP